MQTFSYSIIAFVKSWWGMVEQKPTLLGIFCTSKYLFAPVYTHQKIPRCLLTNHFSWSVLMWPRFSVLRLFDEWEVEKMTFLCCTYILVINWVVINSLLRHLVSFSAINIFGLKLTRWVPTNRLFVMCYLNKRVGQG